MRDDIECRCYVDHLIAEHRRLHKLLRQTRSAIVSSLEPDVEPSFAEIARVLARLRGELEQHFAQEERGGCLEEAVSRCPRLATEAKRIEAEHPQILADLDRLLSDAQELPPTRPNQLAIQHAYDRLHQRLRIHEKAENNLLAQGFGVVVNGEENGQTTLLFDA
jgi:hemerythrin